MAAYGDEKFIYRLTQETSETQENDIKNGFAIIDDVRIAFCEREIVKDKLFMTIPVDFELMSTEMAKIKYPNENRPQIIYTDEEGAITVNFTLMDAELTDEEITEASQALQQVIQRTNPLVKIISNNVITANGISIGHFDFVSPAIDDDVYNKMFIFPIDGQFTLGSFNCLHIDMVRWIDIVEQMLFSIRLAV
jgi:hypothetical protein